MIHPNLTLKVLATTDMHGAYFPYDLIEDHPGDFSIAQAFTYIKEQRNNRSQEIILLDNGDILQGQPAIYYYNFEKTKGKNLCSQIMNYMRYDAASVGNHDIEPGHPVYDKIRKEFNFPWLAANAIKTDTKQPYFLPYTILKRQGIKIAVLGLITPAIPNWLPEEMYKGMEFEDMIISAAKWVKIIQENEKPDILIGLFHSGVDFTTYNRNENTDKNENACLLVARKVPGFDLIIAGHDHIASKNIEKSTVGRDVLVINPKNSAQYLASVTFELNYDDATGKYLKKITGENIELKNIRPDQDFLNKFKNQFEEVKKFVSKPIGEFSESVSSREAMFGDSPFVDLIHQLQLDMSKAEISLCSPLSYDANIEKGTIYVRDLFKLYKFENLLYTMELTGKEIVGYLEFSYINWFSQMKTIDDHLIHFKLDSEGKLVKSNFGETYVLATPFFNFSSADGIKYTVDVTQPEGKRIHVISMLNGDEFDLNKKYSVAINSYQGNGGGGQLTQGAKIPKEELSKRIIKSSDKDLRFYLMKWIERNKVIHPVSNNSWEIIPKEFSDKGREKDFPLLYPDKKNIPFERK
jgi:2',3'-cyclic-nucleotide 2'-phosphodiesterase/3'-nucleotidase